jgi:hypothetical protein
LLAPILPGRGTRPAAYPRACADQIQPSVGGAASGASVQADPLWNHTASAWSADIGIMVVLAVAYALLTWWRLAKTGPARRR